MSFDEAKTVFDDNARLISDPDYSEDEDRFILHCYKVSENNIRISVRENRQKKKKNNMILTIL
ncbi:hypothetical protein [Arcobacter sp. YIC-310]|uniref:hypothetical protein n=1 Tax=Arcobacter sp. YIC-310 TaxID=3376632 RepID=UPI003C1C6218